MPLISIAGTQHRGQEHEPGYHAHVLIPERAHGAQQIGGVSLSLDLESHEREGVREQKQNPGREREGQRAVKAFGHPTVEDRAAAPAARRAARRKRRLALEQIAIVASDKRRGRHGSISGRIKPSIVAEPQVYVGVKSPVLGVSSATLGRVIKVMG